jgi:hypothetical protein
MILTQHDTTGPSTNVFTCRDMPKVDPSFQFRLETALKPMDAEASCSLVLRMFEANYPGISMSDFLHAVTQCSECKLLTPSSSIHTHCCPRLHVEDDDISDFEWPVTPETHCVSRKWCINMCTTSAVALQKTSGGGGRKWWARARLGQSLLLSYHLSQRRSNGFEVRS